MSEAATLAAGAAALPPQGVECRGSRPACAGMDGTRRRCVPQRRGLRGRVGFGRPGAGLA